VGASDGNGAAISSARVDCVPLAGGVTRSGRVVKGASLVTGLAAQRYACAVVVGNAVGEARSNPRLVVGRR
jgi:ADP-ribosylglycohydrolase